MRLLRLALVILILFGCRKDSLEGEKKIFAGKWYLHHYVKHTYSLISPSINYYDTIDQIESRYSIEFKERGKVHLRKDGEIFKCGRFVFNLFKENLNGEITNGYDYSILINNKEENQFWGVINNDTLKASVNGFPFLNTTSDYLNTFYYGYYLKDK